MRSARITSYWHELGDWMRARRAPDVRRSGLLLDRELLGYQHSRARCVPLEDVFGVAGRELVARVRETEDWDESFDVLEDTDYGSREYSVRDPEGNLRSFGTYDPYDYP